jgi:hypothetical protein
LHPHGAVIDLNHNVIVINACRGLTAPINVYYRGKRVTRKVFAAKTVTIPPKSTIAIPFICSSLPKGRYYMFNASYQGARDAITKCANFVVITNLLDKPKKVSAKSKLSIVTEYEEEGCYLVKEFAATEEAILVDKHSENFAPHAFTDNGPTIGISRPTDVLEIIVDNGVYICNLEPDVAQQVIALVYEFAVC